jgi:hypothetical protein
MALTDCSPKKTYSIYKIQHIDPEISGCYIGCTVNIHNRISLHKNDCINYPDRRLYKFIHEHDGFDNFRFEVLCRDVPADAKHIIEQACIHQYNATLNTNRVYLTDEEKLMYHSNYYKNNREHITQRKAMKVQCECGKTYTLAHKARHLNCELHKRWLKVNEGQQN